MPICKSEVWGSFVADVLIVVNSLERFGAKPSSFLGVHMLEGLWGVQHSCVGIENALQMVVYFGNSEEKPSLICIEKIKYKGGKRNPCQLSILKFWRGYHL